MLPSDLLRRANGAVTLLPCAGCPKSFCVRENFPRTPSSGGGGPSRSQTLGRPWGGETMGGTCKIHMTWAKQDPLGSAQTRSDPHQTLPPSGTSGTSASASTAEGVASPSVALDAHLRRRDREREALLGPLSVTVSLARGGLPPPADEQGRTQADGRRGDGTAQEASQRSQLAPSHHPQLEQQRRMVQQNPPKMLHNAQLMEMQQQRLQRRRDQELQEQLQRQRQQQQLQQQQYQQRQQQQQQQQQQRQ